MCVLLLWGTTLPDTHPTPSFQVHENSKTPWGTTLVDTPSNTFNTVQGHANDHLSLAAPLHLSVCRHDVPHLNHIVKVAGVESE